MIAKLIFPCSMIVLVAAAMCLSAGRTAGQDAEETFGCEANPTGDPIGGGEGYRDILTTGDFLVRDTEAFVEALQQAQPGQVIYVPNGVEIDLTKHSTLSIPGGVTLAGG